MRGSEVRGKSSKVKMKSANCKVEERRAAKTFRIPTALAILTCVAISTTAGCRPPRKVSQAIRADIDSVRVSFVFMRSNPHGRFDTTFTVADRPSISAFSDLLGDKDRLCLCVTPDTLVFYSKGSEGFRLVFSSALKSCHVYFNGRPYPFSLSEVGLKAVSEYADRIRASIGTEWQLQ
jgi:hypothetical protein